MNDYDESEREQLLRTAVASIRHGLKHGRALDVELTALPESLQQPRASFVTLNLDGQLRGCIGSLLPERPLIEDVAHNAHAAAFSDPRFPALSESEFPRLEIHISVLSLPESMEVDNEAELLAQLRPGIDGLILEEGYRRATFLPSVWEQLPGATEFVAHLKLKAGLPAHYWSEGLRFERYTTESFGALIPDIAA